MSADFILSDPAGNRPGTRAVTRTQNLPGQQLGRDRKRAAGRRAGVRAVLLVGLVLFLGGCGYRVLGAGVSPAAPAPITIAVPPFTNRSLEVGLETIFANDLLTALNSQSGIRALPGEERADYLLLGTIRKVEYTSLAYVTIEQSILRRTTVTVELVLQKPQGQVVWREQEIIKADYVVGPDYHLGEATRNQGLRQASARLAQRVRDKILFLF